ncbi:hypothetical protein AB4Y44_27565 [Paraburkholderia sp. BR10937]|uniref:hypothetical protein n=1 Tax=Paraburkholderia sp. BR10937 TaxID=3236994 RepID=UPI0034D267E2
MNLEQIYARIWDCLAAAVSEADQPFKARQAATIGLDGSPKCAPYCFGAPTKRRYCQQRALFVRHADSWIHGWVAP